MKNKITLGLLFAIVLLAAVLRLWGLGAIPASPDWDEAALGYNAFSILHTGKDEYGQFMPIVLQSFNDYKPALYTYFIIPLLPLFGLDTFAVRLPSAILGIITVLATYFLVKDIFLREVKNTKAKTYTEAVALLSTFLLAISPWHIQFSRVAFEANAGVACNVLSVLFFLKGLNRPWLLLVSVTFMALNLSVYQSERVFMPLLALALVIIFRKELFALPKKYLVGAVLLGLLVALPLLYYMTTNQHVLARAKGVSVLTQQTLSSEEIAHRYLDDKTSGNVLGDIFHNRRVSQVRDVASGYLSHFDPNWLFIEGDGSRHHAPSMGLLYLWELPFLLIGLYALLFFPFARQTKLFVFAWLLLAPVPAAVTTDVPHAVRTLSFLPTFQIFVALGLITVIVWMKQRSVCKISLLYPFLLFISAFALFNFGYYLNQYFVQQNYSASKDWQYGYEEAIAELKKREGKYDKIVISNVSPMDQSYIFLLFYEQYPPEEYQRLRGKVAGTLGSIDDVHSFDKYEFRPLKWDKEVRNGKTLFIGLPSNFPQDIKGLKTIYYIDGKPAMKFVE